MAIDKNYDPASTEAKLYPAWEQSGAFACQVNANKKPFTIMMPPPNVTGVLHMGHGLDVTIQDILCRYNRMKGRDVLWQPGTDHAGIATQMVVEKQLIKEGLDRRTMGRDAFLKRVWEWKAQSGGTIVKQQRRLGASADWSRERFTMDAGLCKAVTKVFVTLYREGLIYKDTRLVNWDPKLQTSVSDLEAIMKSVKGNLWHFKYPIDGTDEFIVVATTRPETMLGDTGVAVHPEDPRYKHLIGKMVKLPLVGRLIPIVGDEHADPETGTGAVKITPAHDFNDYEVGRRHKLPMINIMDKVGHLNENVPEVYRGMERFEARKKIVADIEALGLLDKLEPHQHQVPHGERSDVPLEPMISEQWYCDAPTLAKPAIEAVEQGKTQFYPKQWENTYFSWMRNIQPWCISRQLWWGHQIPAWYAPDGKVFVAENEADAKAEALKAYGKDVELKRDEDVLDTWFSSALWPFSTLGWPEETPELARYYPTDVLVTGFDIIFFWVARMMMMGLHFMKDVPFRTVYMHALVRDEKGQKMSKTKGNVMDPLVLIDQYGCDAMRFTLANMSTPGRDIKLAPSRIEGNRNFATKLWNAARYCQMNECVWQNDFDPSKVKLAINQWIISETKAAADRVGSLLEDYRFDLTTSAAYEFIWNTFCDWYLEFTKPVLMEGSDEAKAETKATTAWVLAQMVKILHPFMPFVTEELWAQIVGDGALMVAPWPEFGDELAFTSARGEVNWVVKAINALRTVRAELNIPGNVDVDLLVKDANVENQKRLQSYDMLIKKLARVKSLSQTTSVPKGSAQTVVEEATFVLPLVGIIDLEQEKARLQKETAKWQVELKKIESKLGNESFVSRAPEEVVEEHREKKAEAEAMLVKLSSALSSLAA